ncbi:MAG TPA: hypothetical protein P5300_07330 [Acidobacteriota bacterium]|nr:hypothetical protein [Acidobacteriota bacterium]
MRWVKTAVRWLVVVFLAVQLPFLYRLFESRRLSRFLATLPPAQIANLPFEDVPGAIHLHTAAGGHSSGTYPELISAAKQLGLRFLFITEHPREPQLYRPIEDSEIVLIYGREEVLPDGRRELRSPDDSVRIQLLYDLADPDETVTAVEVFNIAENALACNNVLGWGTWLYHRAVYDDLFFFHCWRLDPSKTAFWDRWMQRRRLAATAGNNAHQNIGFVVMSGAGRRWLEVFVDPYVVSLGFVANHVQLPLGTPVEAGTVLEALAEGSSYIVFRRLADPRGFTFFASEEGRVRPMGSEVGTGSRLVAESPLPVRFRLIRDGGLVLELEGRHLEYEAVRQGAYRVELMLLHPPALLRDKPWILSNPIYVR